MDKWGQPYPDCEIAYSLTTSATDSTLWPASFETELTTYGDYVSATLVEAYRQTPGEHTFYLHMESHASSLIWTNEFTLSLVCGENSV